MLLPKPPAQREIEFSLIDYPTPSPNFDGNLGHSIVLVRTGPTMEDPSLRASCMR